MLRPIGKGMDNIAQTRKRQINFLGFFQSLSFDSTFSHFLRTCQIDKTELVSMDLPSAGEFAVHKQDGMAPRRDIVSHCCGHFSSPVTFSNQIQQLVLILNIDFLEALQINTFIGFFELNVHVGVGDMIE